MKNKQLLFEMQKQEEESSFFVSWSDLLSLLLVLFIYLISISTIDPVKLSKVSKSLKEGLIKSEIKIENKEISVGFEEVSELLSSLERNKELSTAITIERHLDYLVLHMGQVSLFESGKSALHPSGEKLLSKVINAIDKKDLKFQVEGHTDNQGISTETFASNWHLSGNRAAEVISFMVKQGIDRNKFTLIAYGPTKPIASNSNNEGRQKNRRVTLIISKINANQIGGIIANPSVPRG